MAESAYMVRESFVVPGPNGMPREVRAGQFIDGKDPLVRTHSHLLQPMSDYVEQMTAGPGERRHIDLPSAVSHQRATTPRGNRRGSRNLKETDMPHSLPPEHEDSPASTFAPFQPGAGVVAEDVVDPGTGQTEEEFTPPKGVEHSKDEAQNDEPAKPAAKKKV